MAVGQTHRSAAVRIFERRVDTMIQRLRRVVAVVVATFVLLVTLGRVRVNYTGHSTALDASNSTRSATTRRIDIGEDSATKVSYLRRRGPR